MKTMTTETRMRKLQLLYLKYTNKAGYAGAWDLPRMHCSTDVYPDYIALFGQPSDYRRTSKTAVAFFQYDNVFDGQHGLYNAIYYGNRKDLSAFKKRFKSVRFAIAPDCSLCGDVDKAEILHRVMRSRVVAIWMAMELGICVIPRVSFPRAADLDDILAGLEDCEVVAFSTKGFVTNAEERANLIEGVKRTVDRLNLKAIVVYDVCKTDKNALDIFDYAIREGVKIVIPDNILKERNRQTKTISKGVRHA